jgi:hypothetical protein
MYRELLFALGGNISLLAAVSWLIKSVLVHFLSKDIETYKNTLKAASDKAIIEHDAVFRSLHAKRADIIANLHAQFIELGKCLNSINNNLQDQLTKGLPLEISAKQSENLIKCLLPCDDYFSKNRLYFSLDLSNELNKLLIDCWAVQTLSIFSQDLNLSSSLLQIQQAKQNFQKDTLSEQVSKIVSDFNVAIKEIENTFRTLIGIMG